MLNSFELLQQRAQYTVCSIFFRPVHVLHHQRKLDTSTPKKQHTRLTGVKHIGLTDFVYTHIKKSIKKKKEPMPKRLTIKCKITKNRASYVPQIHTSHTKHAVLFNVCSNHTPSNYSGQESKQNKNPKTICNLRFGLTCDLEIRSRSSNLV